MHQNPAIEVERLIRQLAPEFADQEITPTMTFEELGMDSLNRMDLLAAAEGHFDVVVPDEEVGKLIRVQDLTDFVASARVG
jgi:acyl carrier protein